MLREENERDHPEQWYVSVLFLLLLLRMLANDLFAVTRVRLLLTYFTINGKRMRRRTVVTVKGESPANMALKSLPKLT